MRIISQNGMIDLPYEQVEVCITRTCTNKIVAFSDNGQRELAEYSTPEKAKKAMEVLREEYLHCERCRARGEETGSIPSYVFQFPQDEEVEVKTWKKLK